MPRRNRPTPPKIVITEVLSIPATHSREITPQSNARKPTAARYFTKKPRSGKIAKKQGNFSMPGQDLSSGTNWHAMEAQAALRRLESDPATGLGSDEAARRLATCGPNR